MVGRCFFRFCTVFGVVSSGNGYFFWVFGRKRVVFEVGGR